MTTFQTKTFGKWILAGEHAVLRGSPALVFPLQNYAMEFRYNENTSPLKIEFSGTRGSELSGVFNLLIEYALKKIEKSNRDLTGALSIHSTLPLGGGLGASAALCAGIARLFAFKKWVEPTQVFECARMLEGIFHGESSGVDIAIALEGRPLKFWRNEKPQHLTQKWQPKLYLSYSGERGVTSECVKKASSLRETNPELAERLDQQMRKAVDVAESALQSDPQTGMMLLSQALEMAQNSFANWGLCSGGLEKHMKELMSLGAIAVKPTGSGGGGYVLSLWADTPPQSQISQELIAL